MLAQEIIRKKRDRQPLTTEDINAFIGGVTANTVSEGQIASFCMAVLLNGMNDGERVDLTMAMAHSGTTLDWSPENLPGPVLDKHSTGGVGDKISLMLGPILAACGAYVPMISGRGLGHTGGTLDKLDSIPGYISRPDLAHFRKTVCKTGFAIVGATEDLAPADKTIYAVRDVTATVESLDLITASILSKKLAAGLQGLVMDVKFGSGAFMQKYEDAKALARSLVRVANGAGLPCRALMTDMDSVLGRTAGNATEVIEAIDFLQGKNIDARLYEVTMALCAELLVLGNIAKDTDAGRNLAEEKLKSGAAAECFARSVAALGGPVGLMENAEYYLPLAPVRAEVRLPAPGTVQAVDVRQVGLAVIELGGGRRLASDEIDHGVGLTHVAAAGEETDMLALIHARSAESAAAAAAMIRKAFTIAPAGTTIGLVNPVREKIGA